jgi:hypothetical protein
VPAGGDSKQKAAAMMQEVARLFEAGIRAHPKDWHMLQRVFAADLDPGRLPRGRELADVREKRKGNGRDFPRERRIADLNAAPRAAGAADGRAESIWRMDPPFPGTHCTFRCAPLDE